MRELQRNAPRRGSTCAARRPPSVNWRWIGQHKTRKGCFGSGYWSFYVPGRGFVSFLSHSWGCVSTLSGLRFGFFCLYLILSGSPPPFYHPASGFSGVPPPEVRIWASNRRPFRVTLANPTPCDASPPSSPTTPYSSESLPSPRHAQSCYRESPNKQPEKNNAYARTLCSAKDLFVDGI